MFNSVDEWSGVDVAAGERKPSFGEVDYEMTYVVRRPCGGAAGAFAFVDSAGIKHGAAVTDNVTNATYLDVSYNVVFDSETKAVQEIMANKEYPDNMLASYKSTSREVRMQLTPSTGQASYCVEFNYANPEDNAATVWNVTDARKVGEALATDGTGRTIRQFVLSTAVSRDQHLMLNDMDTSKSPYTSFYNVTYFDDRATGYPVKFLLGDQTVLVTKYVERGGFPAFGRRRVGPPRGLQDGRHVDRLHLTDEAPIQSLLVQPAGPHGGALQGGRRGVRRASGTRRLQQRKQHLRQHHRRFRPPSARSRGRAKIHV